MKNLRREINQEEKMLRTDLKKLERMASDSAMKKNRVWIKNAAITTINGNAMTITKDGKTYTVSMTNQTKLRRHYGGQATLAEFTVGNFVDVSGVWTDSTKTSINATSIRNRSIMMRRGAFIGEVISKTGNTIVIATKSRGNQTVTVSGTTKYVNRTQQAIKLSDIEVGHNIRVRGLWDKSNNTVTQVMQIKDFSLPVTVTLTPTTAASLSATPSESATDSASAL